MINFTKTYNNRGYFHHHYLNRQHATILKTAQQILGPRCYKLLYVVTYVVAICYIFMVDVSKKGDDVTPNNKRQIR